MKGKMMDVNLTIGDYCDGENFNRVKCLYYNVLSLNICRKFTKLVTYTEDI